jgi:cell division protein FtsB
MRYLALLLSTLLVLVQYPLWYGKGGWLRVWELESELAEQHRVNDERRLRNAALLAEVKDLKSGTDAIEEIARMRLGMVRPGELFVHFSEHEPAEASAATLARSPAAAPVAVSAPAAPAPANRMVRAPGGVSDGSPSPVVAAAR